MSLRNRVNPQQLLAVSFALIMLVSVGGMAFVGGAAAQEDTGGTYEDIAPDENSINDNQNIAAGTGEVVTLSSGGAGVATRDDGAIDFSDPGNANFAGVTIDEDRYASLFDGVNANDGPADQLNALDSVSISSSGTTGIATGGAAGDSGPYPAVLIELAPQSDFSQHPSLSGDEDYILIAGEASQLTGAGSVGAFSVDNDDTDVTQIANGGDVSAVISALGAGTDLTNDNIDQVRIGAGIGAHDVFSDVDGTVNTPSAATVTDIDVTVDGETRLVHNEKIALDDGTGDDDFFATIDNSTTGSASGALQAATDGDQIIVDTGDYSALEPAPITVDKDVTITGATSGDVDTRLDDTLGAADYIDDETVIGTDIQLASDGVTLENLVVGNPGDVGADTQQITNDGSAANVAINNTIVNSAAGNTAIDLTGVSNARTVDNVAVIGNVDGPNAGGGTGLNVDDAGELTVTNSYFAGYQTQVNGDANVDETAIYDSNQFSHAAVPVNETGVVIGNEIAGEIDDGADVAEAGNTIEVTADGIFSNYDVDSDEYDNTVTLNGGDADDLSLVDVDDGATITSSISVNSGGEVSIEGFTVSDSNLDTDGTPSAITVDGTDIGTGNFDLDSVATVKLEGTTGDHYALGPDGSAEDVNVTDADGNHFSIDSTVNVTLDLIEAENDGALGEPLVDIDTNQDGDVSVTDSNIRNLNASDNGIDINAAATDSETVTVSNVTVTGADGATPATNPTAIKLANINTQDPNEYVIRGNDLTELNNGAGVDLDENAGSDVGPVIVDDNEIRSSGSTFVGIAYNLPNTQQVNITANTIVGADVDGAQNSVGVDFEEVAPFSSSNVFQTGSDDVMTFEDNVITGHARLVQDDGAGSATIQASGYNAILTSDELNNSYGTHIVGADGETYAETYGQPTAAGGNEFNTGTINAQSYVPGSINQAVSLVDSNGDNTGADLIVTEPDVGVSGPDTYDDETVVLTDLSGISITGEAADGSVTADTNFSIGASTAENNHTISDLTIENTDGDSAADAIDIASDNAQVEFDNLNVTSDGNGLDVAVSEDDVNVVNVTDSEFTVTAGGNSGISLTGTSDDRDGFFLDNVTVDGPSIGTAGSIGLDLSGVDKPGKDGLPVNLTVTDSDFADFETQISLSPDLAMTASEVLNENVAIDGVTISDNEFEQAVLVLNADGSDGGADLFGSIDAADGPADNGEIIDVQNTRTGTNPAFYNHGNEVTINTDNVEVSGPVSADGSQDVRDNEVVVQDQIVADTTGAGTDVTLDGFAVVTDQSSATLTAAAAGTDQVVIGAAAGTNLTVSSLSVTTTLDSTETEEMPIGIGAVDTGLTIVDTYVGAHNAPDAQTTGTAVVAESAATLTVRDSELNAGNDGDADAATPSDAYGVIAGDNTEPDLIRTDITDFDQAGLQVEDDSLTITDGEISENGNTGDSDDAGIVSSGVNSAATQYEIDGTTIEDNAGDGVALTDVGLNLIDATVSDNGDGVVVASDGVTVDNVSVTDSTVSEHDTTGISIDGANATVSNNSITSNTNGLALTLDDGEAPVVTFNDVSNNGNGLTVNDGASDMTVTSNDFENSNTDIDNQDADQDTLDATLNYFGDLGPNAATGGIADGSETVVYDPFLTKSKLDSSSVGSVEETANFGHDIVIPGGDSIVSIGFPAEPEANTVGGVIDGNVAGAVYKWNQTDQEFDPVGMNAPIGALDVLVVENRDNKPTTAAITYKNGSARNDPVDNTFTFKEGFNFVPATQTGTVSEALFEGDAADYVSQPFSSGENLYGDRGATQVRDQFTTPSADGFGDNFANGVGEEIVHPHVGYFVIVNDEDNFGQTISEQIPSAGVPTANDVDERTGATPATFELSSASATANATTDTVDIIVDVENTGDVDGNADITATALTGLDDSTIDNQNGVTVSANDDTTVQLSITDAGELDNNELVRVEIEVDGTDESVKVTTQG